MRGVTEGKIISFLFYSFLSREFHYLPISRRESSTLKSMYPAGDKQQMCNAYSARELDLSFDLNRGNGNTYLGMRVQHPELN